MVQSSRMGTQDVYYFFFTEELRKVKDDETQPEKKESNQLSDSLSLQLLLLLLPCYKANEDDDVVDRGGNLIRSTYHNLPQLDPTKNDTQNQVESQPDYDGPLLSWRKKKDSHNFNLVPEYGLVLPSRTEEKAH